MFSSLDSADIELKADAQGRRQFVQTDHRTAEEIEEEPALSTLFALIRILNPKRAAGENEPEPVVIYSTQSRPPEFLRRAIRAAGGLLTIGSGIDPEPEEGGAPDLEGFIESSFSNLANAVAGEYKVELTLAGLDVVESLLAESVSDPEEDEGAYWSAVLKLGCFGGELIRTSNGGRWRVVDSGSLPFALSTKYKGEEATVNPLGKAIKRFANGEEDSMRFLVHLLRSQP